MIMDEREELQALRRLAELEARAKGTDADPEVQARKAKANEYAGEDVSKMGALMRGLGGAKVSLDKAALGLKGMLPQAVQDAGDWLDAQIGDKKQLNTESLQRAKAFSEEAGTAGKVGEFAGDLAITAVPGGAAYRGARAAGTALKALPKVGAVLANPFTAATLAGAGTSAALAPEDRGQAAVAGGLGGVLGEGAGRVLAKTLGGVGAGKVSAEAKQLMDEGVNVPFWKALEPGVIRNTAERIKAQPFVGPLMKAQEAAAMRDYNKTLIKSATPPMPVLDEVGNVLRWEMPKSAPVKEVGQEGMRKLGDRFEAAYDAVYKGRTVPIDEAFGAEVKTVADAAQNYTPGIAADVQGAIRRMNDTLRAGTETTRATSPILDASGRPIVTEQLGHAGVNPANVKRALNELNDAVTSAWRQGDKEKAEALGTIRDAVADMRVRGLPPEVQAMLEPVNKAYGNFKLLQRASGSLGAARNEGIVTPQQMTNAVKALDRSPDKSRFAQGTARGQQEAQRANSVLGSELPEVGPGTAEKMALMSGLFGLGWAAPATLGGAAFLTRPGQKLLMGGYGFQDATRGATQRIADVLRTAGIAAGND